MHLVLIQCSRQNFCTKLFCSKIWPLIGQARHPQSWSNCPDLCMNLNFAVKIVELPMWLSISTIFSTLAGSISGDVILFSTASTTPSDVCIPIAVDPSCKRKIRSLSVYRDLSNWMNEWVTVWLTEGMTDYLSNRMKKWLSDCLPHWGNYLTDYLTQTEGKTE